MGCDIAAVGDQGFVDRERCGGDEDGVAVGGRGYDPTRGPDTAAALHILDHDGLPDALTQPCCNHPCDRVGKTAGGETDDECDALVRIARTLGDRGRWLDKQRGKSSQQERCG